MITVFLCDDEPNVLEYYENQIKSISETNDINVLTRLFSTAEQLMFEIEDNLDVVDIIYLDILMGDINGMEAARKLRQMGCNAQIMFITSSEEYVFEAFDIAPVQYLLKGNTSLEKFQEVYLKAVTLARSRKEEMFSFDTGRQTMIIPVADIMYFEIWKRLIKVHCYDGETYEYYGTMEQLQNQLKGKSCIRVHRSFLINMRYISAISKNSVTLKNGDTIPIGITYLRKFEHDFSEYMDWV